MSLISPSCRRPAPLIFGGRVCAIPLKRLAEGHETEQQRKIQKQLDEALEDSFPASDPVSIVTSQEEEDWGEGENAPPPSPAQPKAL
jgi:hypothetical protein